MNMSEVSHLTFDELGKSPSAIIKGRMKKKDAALFDKIEASDWWEAIQIWRNTYPEDFEGVDETTALADVVRNIGNYVKPIPASN